MAATETIVLAITTVCKVDIVIEQPDGHTFPAVRAVELDFAVRAAKWWREKICHGAPVELRGVLEEDRAEIEEWLRCELAR